MKISLLILLSLVISHVGFCQKIFFTDTSNQWIVDYHEFDPGVDKRHDVFYQYTGTTLLTGQQYLILESYSYSLPSTTALIREDTAEKKVYARNISANDTAEHLLYDYTLTVGDTFLMYHPSDTFTHYVSHIDTLSINGIAHRRWYFTHIIPNTIDYEVVEGAGCMRDPLTPYFPKQPYGSGWFLKCFSNAHTGTTASNPSWYTSNCMLSIDDLVSISDAIKMYPNPAHEDVSLELQAATNRATLITVYDNIGRLLLRLIPQPGQQKLKLNTSGWTSGVYLVNASFQDGTFRTVKLVIEN